MNVHPQKTEIRFDDEQALWQIFNAAVREALGKTGVVPLMDFEIDPSIDIPVARKGVIYREPDLGVDPSFNPFDEERKTSGADRPFPAYGRGRESRDRVSDWSSFTKWTRRRYSRRTKAGKPARIGWSSSTATSWSTSKAAGPVRLKRLSIGRPSLSSAKY